MSIKVTIDSIHKAANQKQKENPKLKRNQALDEAARDTGVLSDYREASRLSAKADLRLLKFGAESASEEKKDNTGKESLVREFQRYAKEINSPLFINRGGWLNFVNFVNGKFEVWFEAGRLEPLQSEYQSWQGIPIIWIEDKNLIPKTLCAVCGRRQYPTKNGLTCSNRHGGAPSVDINPTKEQIKVALLSVFRERSDKHFESDEGWLKEIHVGGDGIIDIYYVTNRNAPCPKSKLDNYNTWGAYKICWIPYVPPQLQIPTAGEQPLKPKFKAVEMSEFMDTKTGKESFGVKVQKEDGSWSNLADASHIFVYEDEAQCRKVIKYIKENPYFQETPAFFLEGLDPDFQNLKRTKKHL